MKDFETQKIEDDQKFLFDLINHEGWAVARRKLIDRIMDLQNVAEYVDEIQTGNATRLLREMKANKRAAEILFDWLRDVEGTGTQILDNVPKPPSYVVKLED